MDDTRCGQCKHYAPLKNPYHYDKSGYPDGVTVYGFCAKDAAARFGFYPVYVPDGGQCNAFKKSKDLARDKPIYGQIEQIEMKF